MKKSIVLALLALAAPLHAASSAYTIPGTGTWSAVSTTWGAIGYEFTTSVPIVVSHLGVHDWHGDGLTVATPVGIWNSTIGNLVATTTVPAGTGASLVEANYSTGKDYLQALASPVTLPAGTYVIANRHQGAATETFGYGGNVTMAGGLSITKGWAIAGGGTFQDPRNAGGFSNTVNPTCYIGPQFKFQMAVNPSVTVTTASSEADNAFAAEVTGGDLANSGQPTLTSFTSSVAPYFGAGGQNNGSYNLADVAAAAWYRPAGSLPAMLTFELNVAAHPAGYEISSIRTFAGWKAGGTQTYANQKYSVEYRAVGSSTWTLLQTVDYSPFTNLNNTPANTKVSLTSPSGLLATGVAAVRFNLMIPTQAGGTNNGTVLQEIDIVGQAVGSPPVAVTLTAPATRSLFQRSPANTGSIPISGTYEGSPDIIEARAVVMSGSGNSGTTTAWQTLVTSPSGGTFSGTLTGVPAGGWYQVEVRTLTNSVASAASSVGKVGIGDIYITAGQSNSANHGTPAYTPADDHVCTRTSLGTSIWRAGYDPQPLATGSGGSPWSRLGDLLAAADNVPIGFLSVGVGSTQVSQWLPGTTNYNTLLKPAVQSLPAGGFRAILWHQGESDSIANTTAATYADRITSIIAQSRTDAGWSVPWYLAEASFHPNTNLSQEEPVTAGQRIAAATDPLVFLGPDTDRFHLQDAGGGLLGDSVHFNAAGLLDHATQWRDILRGTTTTAPRNGDFEDNRTPSITGLSPLADGASHLVTITSNNDSPSTLGWRILSADGLGAADGGNGFHNPTTGTFAAAIDTSNGGILPGMAGRHVAMLEGGSPGNHFLHTTRRLPEADTDYVLGVSIGVRDLPSNFGGARIDLLSGGQVLATTTLDKTALDTLRGSDSTGAFTRVRLVYTSPQTLVARKPLAIRIAKVGGAGTVLDFDQVTLTAAPNGYAAFRNRFWAVPGALLTSAAEDSDRDGIANGIEYFMGSDPTTPTTALMPVDVELSGLRWKRFRIPLDPAVTDSGLRLQYSFNLTDWNPAATSPDGSVTNLREQESWTLDISEEVHPVAFFRVVLDPILPAAP